MSFLLVCSVLVASAQDARRAVELVRGQWVKEGGAAADLADVVMSASYSDPATGVVHTYLRQRAIGIPVFPGIFGVHTAADGTLLKWDAPPVRRITGKATNATPALNALAALQKVAADKKVPLPALEMVAHDASAQRTTYRYAGTVDEPAVALVWYAVKDELFLAWQVDLPTADGAHWWVALVDARNGNLLSESDRVISCDFGGRPSVLTEEVKGFVAEHPTAPDMAPAPPGIPNSYRVYAFPTSDPADGPRTVVTAPWLLAPNASPFGWHDTNGMPGAETTQTHGNNVRAFHDTLGVNPYVRPGPDGGTQLSFDAPLDLAREPHAYLDAAIINLFYANNVCHDVAQQYGFHPAAGNFQEHNYGQAGEAGDPVVAHAQDASFGGAVNNANFLTLGDGRKPRMQMYRFDYTQPKRDSDLDNVVIAHEYAHGISNRLVGGPFNVDCLFNAERMGEGWSDFFGLMLTMKSGDTGTQPSPVATYLLGQTPTGNGFRPVPYSTDLQVNAYTYANTNAVLSQPHGIGFVWCTMLWEVAWDLVGQYGFDPDMYNGTGGNNRALHLVIEGMKLTPCSPGFVDARNAILEADRILYGGADLPLLWSAFARRGLGYSADQGDPNLRNDQVEAFDLPPTADVELFQLLSPEAGHVPTCALGILQVSCVVRNLGTSPQSFFAVKYQVDNNPIQAIAYGGSLLPGARDTITFSGQIGGLLQTAGGHTIRVWTQLAGDGNLANDTAVAVLNTYAAPSLTIPYSEDFEQQVVLPVGQPCAQVSLSNGWYNVPQPVYTSANFTGEALDFRVANGASIPQVWVANYPATDHTSGTNSGHYLRANDECTPANAHSDIGTLNSPCFSVVGTIAPKLEFASWILGLPNSNIKVDGWWNGRWNPISPGWLGPWDPDGLPTMWEEHQFALPADISQNMVVRFRVENSSFKNCSFDDIHLIDTYTPITAAIGIDRAAFCRGDEVRLEDATLNPDPTTEWSWTITPATYVLLNGTDLHSQHVELMPLNTGVYQVQLITGNGYDTDTVQLAGGFGVEEGVGHAMQVRTDQWGADFSWQVRTAGGAVHASGGGYPDHPNLGTYVQPLESFCLPGDGCYELVLNDPFEGICCYSGNGSVELFDAAGHLLVQGTMLETDGPQLVIPFCSPASCISLPWTETFEAGSAGWTQGTDDDTDWLRRNVPFLNGNTVSDHTTGTGYALTIPGVTGYTQQRRAVLRSPCIDLSGAIAPVLSFWYVSRQFDKDSLFMDIERNGQVHERVWENVATGFGWQQAVLDLSGYAGASIQLRFRGSKHFISGAGVAIDDIQISGTSGIHFGVQMALEGPYDSGTGLMRDDLRTQSLLPTIEPYTALGHQHRGGGGNEIMSPGLLATTGAKALVDWVLLELRDGNDANSVLATKSALLCRDGTVVDIQGNPDLSVPLPLDVYFLRVVHRNHLGCTIANGVEFDTPPPTLNFRDPNPALMLGPQARKVIGGTAVLWSGDVTHDSRIQYTGQGNDRDRILSVIGGAVPTNTVGGYLQEDLDLNGVVKYTGAGNDRDRILQNIGGVVPTIIRSEVVP